MTNKLRNFISISTLFFLFIAASSFGQSPSGPTTGYVNVTTTYSYSQGTTFPNVSWSAVKGTVTSTWSSGPVYYATVKWTATGAGSVTISGVNTSTPTLNVTVTTCPTISTPSVTNGSTVCGPGTATMSATVGSGGASVNWYAYNGTTVLYNGNSYSPSITTTTNYQVTSLASSGCESARVTVTATLSPVPTTANAGGNQTICVTSGATLAANTPTSGTGAWSVSSGPSTATSQFSNVSSPTSTFTPAGGAGTYVLTWTISINANCKSTSNATMTVNALPTTSNAGSNQTLCGGITSTTLAANTPTVGTGFWTASGFPAGTLGNPNSPTSTFSGSVGNPYSLQWTISNGACPSSISSITVNFSNTALPQAYAGNDQGVCQNTSATLAATATNGTGIWSVNSGPNLSTTQFNNTSSPTALFTPTAAGSYVLKWTVTNASGCTASSTVTISSNAAAPSATAGPDQTDLSTCGSTTVTLNGNMPNGVTGNWSIVSGAGTFSNPSLSNSTFTGTAGSSSTLKWTLSTGLCSSSSTMNVKFNQYPTVSNAGSNQAICLTGNAVLTANTPTVGTGAWTVVSGPSTSASQFSNANSPTAIFTPAGGVGTYVLTWTISNSPCASSFSNVTITVSAVPTTAIAGPSQTDASTCGFTTVTLAANTPSVGTGSWSVVSGGGGSFGNASSATSTFSGAAGTAYTLKWTISNGACTTSSSNVNVTFNKIPTSSNAGVGQAIWGTGSVTLSANIPAVGSGIWSVSSGPSTSLSQFNSTTNSSGTFTPVGGLGNYVLNWTISNSPCASSSSSVTISAIAMPVITSSGSVVLKGSTVTLDAGTGYVTYVWRNSSGVQVATSQTYTTSLADTYTVTVTKYGYTSPPSLPYTLLSQFSGLNMNYIVTNAVMVDNITNPLSIDQLTVDQANQAIQYFDGLGRSLQTVSTQGSPGKADLVQAVVYDNYNRESKKYLPFTNGSNGWYKTDPIGAIANNYTTSTQYTFYHNGTSDKIIDDTRPFIETIFEPSPLNRPSKDYGPGNDWGPTTGGGNDKYVYHQYLVNHDTTVEKIIAWKIDSITNLPVRRKPKAGYIVKNGYYAIGQLNIKSTKDEQGHEVREYVDKLGHTILKKVYFTGSDTDLITNGNWTQTYYIYDDLGLLRFVLQPELTKFILTQPGAYNPSANDLAGMAFQYKYDNRHRMVVKKVPGADSVYMVYDKHDRLILTQDGNQRAGATNAIKYWTFTKYDQLNRPILTGIKDTTTTTILTRVLMQGAVDAHFAKTSAAWSETFVGAATTGNIHGYTNKAYPVITGSTAGEKDPNKYLTVAYYDNYTFRSDWPGTYAYLNENLSATSTTGTYTQATTENNFVLGHATGGKTKVLDGGITGGYTWLRSITYYDDKYRVTQTQNDNYKGGKDIVSNVYDFAGKVIKSKETQTITTMTNQVATRQVGNKMLKSIAGAAWSSGFSSIQQLPAGTDGWMEFTASENNLLRAIGLSQTDANTNYNTINYGFYLTSTGTLQKCENTATLVTLGTYVSGDVLRIERTGTAIKYYKNNVLLNTSTVASTTSLLVDGAFYSAASTLVNIRTSFTNNARTITHRFIYDHVQRLVESWHQLDTQPEYRTVFNEYNEIGQLVDKKLHSTTAYAADNKQSVDYRYNIRGWLTSMNNSQLASDTNVTNDDTNDYFGMNLLYQQNDTNLGSTGLFNGNISGMKWSSNLGQADIKETGYNFTYDALNRLLNANARMNKTNVWQAGYYNESISLYDLNGNIKNLTRTGDAGNQIDNLAYNYGTAGNQLQYVQDNTTDATNKAKGFVDGHTGTTTDYTYDANGNMTRDLNKGIGATVNDAINLITYNFLNLPDVVSKAGNTIQYIYTANGQKLSQVVTNVNTNKQTDYVGAYIYENDALQFINHEEGRIVMSGTKMVYTNSFNTVTADITGINTTPTTYSLNGENYVKGTATTAAAGNGLFPIGGTFTVQPGDRYRIRFKGYRTTHAAYLQVKTGATVLSSPGTALPNSAATESWIEQIVTIPASTTTMQVGVVWATAPSANEVMYLNELEVDQLTTSTSEYQYNLKDHLGNVRVTFTTAIPTTTSYTANFEDATNNAFNNYMRTSFDLVDHTDAAGTTYTYVQWLNGGASGRVGLAKSLAVMPGDQVSISAYAKFMNLGTVTNTTSLITALASAFGVSSSSTGIDGKIYSGLNGYAGTVPSGNHDYWSNPDDETEPKCFVNILFFDKDYNLINAAWKQVTSAGEQTSATVKQPPHDFMSLTATAPAPGYAFVFLSNEHYNYVDMYFDDVTVSYTPSPIVQQEDFYPFGLKFNSFARENSVPNTTKLFEGQEHIDDLGLNWDQFKWRNYQPDIGRFFNIDPLAEKYVYNSTYAFAENKVITFRELEGLEGVHYMDGNDHVIEKNVMVLLKQQKAIPEGADAKTVKKIERQNARIGRENASKLASVTKELNTFFNGSNGKGTQNSKGENVVFKFNVMGGNDLSKDDKKQTSTDNRNAIYKAFGVGNGLLGSSSLDPGRTLIAPAAVLTTEGAGGDQGNTLGASVMRVNANAAEGAVSHEVLHTLGLPDNGYNKGGLLNSPPQSIATSEVDDALKYSYKKE